MTQEIEELTVCAPSTLSTATTLVGSPPLEGAHFQPKLKAIEPSTSVSHLLTGAFRADVFDPPKATPAPRKIRMNDLRVVRVLGRGGQGEVVLVKDRVSRRAFALKSIAKHALPKAEYANAFVEQEVMRRTEGRPEFASLYASFQNEDYLFLMMVRQECHS